MNDDVIDCIECAIEDYLAIENEAFHVLLLKTFIERGYNYSLADVISLFKAYMDGV